MADAYLKRMQFESDVHASSLLRMYAEAQIEAQKQKHNQPPPQNGGMMIDPLSFGTEIKR